MNPLTELKRPSGSNKRSNNPVTPWTAFKTLGELANDILRKAFALSPAIEAEVLKDEDQIREARKLSTEIFAHFGKIDPQEVLADGTLKNDPFHEISTYFGAYRNDGKGGRRLVAALRIMHSPTCTPADYRLPVGDLPPESQEFLSKLRVGTVAEEGALAKRKGESHVAVMKIHKLVIKYARENGIEYIAGGLEPKAFPTYRQASTGAIFRLHPQEIPFPGIAGMQVPLLHDMRYWYDAKEDLLQSVNKMDAVIRFFIFKYLDGSLFTRRSEYLRGWRSSYTPLHFSGFAEG